MEKLKIDGDDDNINFESDLISKSNILVFGLNFINNTVTICLNILKS